MKILLFIRSFFAGGAEKALLEYAKGLHAQGHDITILVRHPDGDLKDQFLALQNQGIHVDWCFSHLKPGQTLLQKAKNFCLLRIAEWSYYKSPRLFYRLAIHDRFDVEIAFMHNEAASLIAASANSNSKKILWVHTDLRQLSSFKTYFGSRKRQEKCYRKFHKCVCVSQLVANSMTELFGITDTLQVILNPIDRTRILSLAHAARPIPATHLPIVCAVGRLSPEKNFSLLINSHKDLIEDGFPHLLYIVGDGPERNALEQEISALGLENSVTLVGFQNNPYPYIAAANFTVCSSIYEGLHIVSQESLVLGVPVVSGCQVVSEVFGKHHCGIITENTQPSITAAMKKMLNDKSFYDDCVTQAKLRGEELDATHSVSQLIAILQ